MEDGTGYVVSGGPKLCVDLSDGGDAGILPGPAPQHQQEDHSHRGNNQDLTPPFQA